MPMPGSGQISLDDARDEFGVSGQIAMGDLYRGGSLVPNVSANSGVPTSGQISLSNLYSATNEQVTVSGSGTISSLNQSVILFVRADGTIDSSTSDGVTQLSPSTDWIIPNGAASGSYEVRATHTGGSAPDIGTLNTWLAISVDRGWGFNAVSPGPGTISGTILIEIRDGSGVLDSGSYPLSTTTT